MNEVESEYGIRILYACESGSRAWGFASDDSDYDVRFLYVHPRDWYLSVLERDDSIDLPIDENELDLGGWDLRKALRLLMKSNGALLEWLHSPIVYQEQENVVAKLRGLVPEILSPKALGAHYLGLCKKTWKGSLQADEVSAKKYLYALRSLLSARFVTDNQAIAAVDFSMLRDGVEVGAAVEERINLLVDFKKQGEESSEMPRDEILHAFIEAASLRQANRAVRGQPRRLDAG